MESLPEDVWGDITDEELQNIPLDNIYEKPSEVIGTNDAIVQDKHENKLSPKEDEHLNVEVHLEVHNVKDTSPLHYLRNGYLWVSDLSTQLWCEQKMFYKFTVPAVEVVSPAITTGASLHLARELAVHDTVPVKITSREDHIAVKLINLLIHTESIFAGASICREIPIFGIPFDKDVYLTGIIDEIKCDQETFQFDLVELKTRAIFKSLPGKSLRDTHKLQVMMYKKLFDDLVMGKMKKEAIAKHLRLDLSKPLGDDVALHKGKYSVKTLDGLLDLVFDRMKSFPFINQLFIEYCSQDDSSTICFDEIVYDEVWLKSTFDHFIAYWKGDRPLQGVEIEDAWKCQRCEFADMCSWRARKASHYAKTNMMN